MGGQYRIRVIFSLPNEVGERCSYTFLGISACRNDKHFYNPILTPGGAKSDFFRNFALRFTKSRIMNELQDTGQRHIGPEREKLGLS